MAGFSFENHIRKTEETVESTGIGIQSIRNMTLKMKAKCQVEQEGDQFRLTILFPVKYKIEQQA